MANNNGIQLDDEVKVKNETKIDEPPRYKVLLHNDNYTTMDFVISILCRIFHKNISEATRIMLKVHKTGIGECGSFTKEVAETKVRQVLTDARLAGFPLNCTMEKE